jgi:hypothetical protein
VRNLQNILLQNEARITVSYNRDPWSTPTPAQRPLFQEKFSDFGTASSMDNPMYDICIDLAIADLSEQVKPNYSTTAKRFNVERTTLCRRFQGEQASRAVANSEH